MSSKTEKYSDDIKTLMQEMSKEIGVNIVGHPSRVLVFLITDVSMGDTVGLKVDLQLGEYVLRKDYEQAIFGVTSKIQNLSHQILKMKMMWMIL